ncbi:MAG: flagellar biosynthesis protein FlgA, partial [Burkholderiaceae bacterium]|nr:flagellar biosynthesis protein FlgA [Burkholderiaceae bacterium]
MHRRLLTTLLACIAPAALAAPWDETVRLFALREAAAAAGGGHSRIEVAVGSTDAARAPCDRFEPFLPRGARLWGRSQVGVRCVGGGSWSVWVPVTVRTVSYTH